MILFNLVKFSVPMINRAYNMVKNNSISHKSAVDERNSWEAVTLAKDGEKGIARRKEQEAEWEKGEQIRNERNRNQLLQLKDEMLADFKKRITLTGEFASAEDLKAVPYATTEDQLKDLYERNQDNPVMIASLKSRAQELGLNTFEIASLFGAEMEMLQTFFDNAEMAILKPEGYHALMFETLSPGQVLLPGLDMPTGTDEKDIFDGLKKNLTKE